MPDSVIAIQLYTLRDFLKSPPQIAATLSRLGKIGYRAVELAGLGPIDPQELARILQDQGMTVCGAHVPIERLKSEPNRVIDENKLWNCHYIAVPGFWPKQADEFVAFATDYNHLAAQFEPAGFRLGYHNHSHEMVRHNGRTILSMLTEKLNPSLWFEIDTYWIVHGGGDPIQWIDGLHGRVPCVHLKDMSIDAQGHQHMAEIGEGNLNFPGILAACRGAGTQWYVVEQDICLGDPFESVAISLRNLKAMGID
jgi:sugar phosphate isomerase/epimerase